MAGLAGFTRGEGGENARGQIAKTRLGARFVGRGLSVQGGPLVVEDPGPLPGRIRQAGGEACVFAHVVHHYGGEDRQVVFGAVHADALQQGAQLILALFQPGLPGQLGITNGGAFLCRLDEDVPQLVVAG